MPNKFELELHIEDDPVTKFVHQIAAGNNVNIAVSDGNKLRRWVGKNILPWVFLDETGEESPWHSVSEEILLKGLQENRATGGLWIHDNGIVKKIIFEKGTITYCCESSKKPNNWHHKDQLEFDLSVV